MPPILRVLPAALLLAASPAWATSYTALPDAQLFDQADAVVLGHVSAVMPQPGQEREALRYELRAGEVLKGAGTPATLALVVPGTDPAQEGALVIPGAPRFSVDEAVLLFLSRRADGGYAVTQFLLGAFHVRTAVTGETLLLRELGDAEQLPDPKSGTLQPERRRELSRFRRWLQLRGAGGVAEPDYWTEAEPLPQAKYRTHSSPPARWVEFEQGSSVRLLAGSGGQLSLFGGGYTEFQKALQAWNDDPGSNIRFSYGGITAALGGLGSADGSNTILFNDPLQELAGSYDCSNGGVVAYAGYRSGAVRGSGSTAYRPIVEADVVVQDGAGCILSKQSRANAAEVFAHELGHALGLAHACGEEGAPACTRGSSLDEALMRPTLHGDGRGAALGADDRAGVAALYPVGRVLSLPEAPTAPADSASASPAQSGAGGGGGSWNAMALLLAALLRRGLRTTPRR
ncbi:MAG TPA: matrixin family metalloprotease [Solimonas sp.]|nr:matrixin family metalloprotease [Solimonas sp.]